MIYVNDTTLQKLCALLFTLACFLSSTAPISAHHSAEMFNRDEIVTLVGTVKEFRYINPHSWLIVDIENDDGTITTWGFEGEGPQDMMQGGVRKNDLPPGAKITITGNPMHDGRPAAMWETILKEDGTLLNWRTPGTD